MTSRQTNTQEDKYLLIMSILQESPDITQRELATQLGLSLGVINFCLGALIDKGFVKMANFQKSKNKFKYIYLLTPRGISEKVELTSKFLQRKIEEYESLKVEIEALKTKVGGGITEDPNQATR